MGKSVCPARGSFSRQSLSDEINKQETKPHMPAMVAHCWASDCKVLLADTNLDPETATTPATPPPPSSAAHAVKPCVTECAPEQMRRQIRSTVLGKHQSRSSGVCSCAQRVPSVCQGSFPHQASPTWSHSSMLHPSVTMTGMSSSRSTTRWEPAHPLPWPPTPLPDTGFSLPTA